MLFNSLAYLIFLPAVVLLYYRLTLPGRWILIFVASCGFYMAFIPVYILFLFLIIGLDYGMALGLDRCQNPRTRRGLLVTSIVANFGLLGFFKYYNWAVASVAVVLGWPAAETAGWLHSWVLPLGLSFHTFQSVSYVVEVYRGRFPVERNPLVYANYVLFFPQLVAGPIERPQNLIPQLRRLAPYDYANLEAGFELILVGFVKKILIADNLARFVSYIFARSPEMNGAMCWLGAVCFGLQIYCDFSGYTDIARGSARMLGIRLMVNFAAPYMAVSLRDFWHRWHISLSSWFRDYVYIPLGGGRAGPWRVRGNLLVVFLLSGLWHGANWTFVLWGLVHALAFILIEPLIVRCPLAPVRWLLTMAVVFGAWVFFRAADAGQAWLMLGKMARPWEEIGRTLPLLNPAAGELVALLLAAALVIRAEGSRERLAGWYATCRMPVRAALWNAVILSLIFLGNNDSRQFIYFQF